jgi:DNA-binding transcriptional MocR family regulator
VLNLALDPKAGLPLVEQLVNGVRQQVQSRLLRPGARVPSIRQLAASLRVSRFTVIEAYDRLVASGELESRRGSGFFVAPQRIPLTANERCGSLDRAVDVANLLSQLCADDGLTKYCGGCFPDSWLEDSGIRRYLRLAANHPGHHVTNFGTTLGYRPLREFLVRRLAELDIATTADCVLLTHGATHGFDLLIRYLLQPGDAVLVDDPGYYNLLGHLKLAGVRLLGVPRGIQGPDLTVLERLAREHQPKAYFTQSLLSNPTSTHIPPSSAYRLLRLAEAHRFVLVEDDIFADLLPGGPPRLAALDQLQRVFYIGSYSKMISSSIRVGFIAAQPEAIHRLSQVKLLTGMTTSEFAEHTLHQMLIGGHYRKHASQTRDRLARARERMLREFERAGWTPFHVPDGGGFLWVRHPDVADALPLAEEAVLRGMRLAPGAAFRPDHGPSPWLRFTPALGGSAALYELLSEAPAIAARKDSAAASQLRVA